MKLQKAITSAVTLALMVMIGGCTIPRIPDKQVRYFERHPEKKIIEKKNRALATALNLIPGLGQAYNEDYGDAVLTFFTSWLVIPWIFGFADANLTAKFINYEHSYNEYNPGK